jgi:glycosyltransferase involved in cell wall biosynthesis
MQGGVGDYTRELGQALAAQGCDVAVLTSRHAGPATGISIYPAMERWGWGLWRALERTVRRQTPDVIHVQYQAAAYAMHPAVNLLPRQMRIVQRLRRARGPRPWLVVTFHDLKVPYLFPKAGRLRRWVVTELARSSDAAITTNREDYEQLGRDLGPGADAPALIPIGSNIAPRLPAEYDPDTWRARWGAGPDELLIAYFGFVNARKGVDTLVDAVHLLATGEDAASPRLLMIGGRTGASDPTNVAYLAGIEAQIEKLGIDDRVTWTGYLPPEEVSASFAAANVCALPFRDGASFLHGTFHAALAHGVPIVTTEPRVPLPELVHGENVWLVPRSDAPALARALRRVGGDPAVRRRLGAGARALADEFRWEKIAAETLALYRSLGAGA